MELTAKNVNETFLKCLFKEGDDTVNAVKVDGVMLKVGFDPAKLEAQTENIIAMLNQLPEAFRKSHGGGWSFLNAVHTNNGEQWADLHQSVDELLTLGLAIGKVAYAFPRNMWVALPGSMPYFYYNDID